MECSSNNSKMDLCSSTCCCPLLRQMHDNFVRKFKVHPNGGNGGEEITESLSANEAPLATATDDSIIPLSGLLQEAIESGEPMACFSGEEDNSRSNDAAAADERASSSSANCVVVGEGGINFEIVDEESRTPMPFYEMMSELELNTELAKYGHGPMGKRAAIRLLNQIFDATHPVLSTTTPIPRKIARILAPPLKKDSNEQARQKRAKAKIAQLMGKPPQVNNGKKEGKLPNDKDGNGIEDGQQICCLINNEKENGQQPERIKPATDLTQTFLSWLRKAGNEQQYNELLLLNPVFFDKLYSAFKQDAKGDNVKTSKEAFMEMLDKLGVTYCCSRNDPMENQ